MNKTQWYLISLSTVFLALWIGVKFANMQNTLSQPLNLPVSENRKLPEISTVVQSLFTIHTQDVLSFSNNKTWGIVPRIDPKNPPINAVVFTPSIAGKSPRICTGLLCYDFMGLIGKKALFYDTNLSATKKTVLLGRGALLNKPIRIKNITADTVTLIDTKTKTTYEMSLFKIDLEPYKPKSPKGK